MATTKAYRAVVHALLVGAVFGAAGMVHAQDGACQPRTMAGVPSCVGRQGHCLNLSLGGQSTQSLLDFALQARLHRLISGVKACWQVAQPLQADFAVVAAAGGLSADWLGAIQQVNVSVTALDDYDPAVGGQIEDMGRTVIENGKLYYAPFDRTPQLLKPGEYLLTFRVMGSNNWDRQSVFVRVVKP